MKNDNNFKVGKHEQGSNPSDEKKQELKREIIAHIQKSDNLLVLSAIPVDVPSEDTTTYNALFSILGDSQLMMRHLADILNKKPMLKLHLLMELGSGLFPKFDIDDTEDI